MMIIDAKVGATAQPMDIAGGSPAARRRAGHRHRGCPLAGDAAGHGRPAPLFGLRELRDGGGLRHAEVGPDGAVWVADFQNFIIQHNPTPSMERGGFVATTGKGGFSHLTAAMFFNAIGASFVNVPYKGEAPALRWQTRIADRSAQRRVEPAPRGGALQRAGAAAAIIELVVAKQRRGAGKARRDFAKLSLGLTMQDRAPTAIYLTDEVDRRGSLGPFATLFAEYRPDKQTTMRLDVDNLFDLGSTRDRSFYAPSRVALSPTLDEYRFRNSHPMISATLRRTFSQG